MDTEQNEIKASPGVGVDRLDLLMRLTGQINSNSDLDSLLSDIIDAAKIIMESEASSLFLIDDETDELVLNIPTGPMTDELTGVRLKKDEGIGGWVVTNSQTVIIEDVYNDPRFKGDFNPDQFKTRNLICVPLKNHDQEVIGALQAMNKRDGHSYNSYDVTMFQALANQAAIAIENARLYEQQLQKQLMEQQLNLAHSIQSGFWPKVTPAIPGYKVAGTSKPASWVGGDYYDYIENGNENEWGFALGDVTGKGMPAALLMASIRSVLRAHIENKHSLETAIKLVNKNIFKDTPVDKFITLFYGVLDSNANIFRYVNAGHNTPYLVDFKKNLVKPLEGANVMLGILENVDYACHEIRIEPGQQIVIYSDGVTEAQNKDGDFYEEPAFEEWLLQHPHESPSEIISAILSEIKSFANGTPQSDDITVIIIKRNDG